MKALSHIWSRPAPIPPFSVETYAPTPAPPTQLFFLLPYHPRSHPPSRSNLPSRPHSIPPPTSYPDPTPPARSHHATSPPAIQVDIVLVDDATKASLVQAALATNLSSAADANRLFGDLGVVVVQTPMVTAPRLDPRSADQTQWPSQLRPVGHLNYTQWPTPSYPVAHPIIPSGRSHHTQWPTPSYPVAHPIMTTRSHAQSRAVTRSHAQSRPVTPSHIQSHPVYDCPLLASTCRCEQRAGLPVLSAGRSILGTS